MPQLAMVGTTEPGGAGERSDGQNSSCRRGSPNRGLQDRNNLQLSQKGTGVINAQTLPFCYLPIFRQPLPLAKPNWRQKARKLVDEVHISQPLVAQCRVEKDGKWI